MLLWLLIPLLLIIPGISEFFYAPGSHFSDLVISHYPNALYLRQALLSGQGIPLWSDTILSGYPYAADPLSGLWYPPLWLSVGLPLPLGFNLLMIIHMLWGGLGMFYWLKAEGIKPSAAIVGALAFEAMPKLISHFAAGHITLVFAVTWTPWLLWAEKNWSIKGNWRTLLRSPGLVLGFICLADIRWAAYAGILWVGYSLVVNRINIKKIPTLFIRLSGHVALALLIAGPLILPLLEYTRMTTRTALTPEDVFTLSLPPARLLGFLFPDPGVYAEWSLYPGSVALIGLGLAIIVKPLRRRLWLWFWVLGLSIVFALGTAVPYLPWLANLPGISLFRVPARALFLNGLAFAVITAYAVDFFLVDTPYNRKPLNLYMVGLTSFVLLMVAGVGILTGSFPINFWWGGVCIFVSAGVASLFLNTNLKHQYLATAFILISLVNLGLVNWLSLDSRPTGEVLGEGSQAVSYLRSLPQPFRTYSPSYSIPQQTAALAGLQMADGIDPLQLTTYVTYMQAASGVPADGYSVTLPPFKTGDPKIDNKGFIPNAELLGWLNVKFIISEYDLSGSEGLVLKEQFGETRIYENSKVKPRAWIQPSDTSAEKNSQVVDIIQDNPNQIILNADGPGLLVLSEITYPGWQIKIDQKKAKNVSVMGLLRGVELPAGKHQVEFIYKPASLLWGMILALIAWCGMVALRER